MLEFVIVYFLAKRIGGIVEAKGHSGTGYKWLTAGLWFGGEILGFVIGFSATGPHGDVLAAYPFALAGAVLGAVIAWQLAKQVQVNPSRLWSPNAMTPPSGMQGWAQPDPAQPPALAIPGNVELRVENRVGDWAQVSASNGWRGFVDARMLVARPGL
jgi:hypothetical protein